MLAEEISTYRKEQGDEKNSRFCVRQAMAVWARCARFDSTTCVRIFLRPSGNSSVLVVSDVCCHGRSLPGVVQFHRADDVAGGQGHTVRVEQGYLQKGTI